MRFGIFALTLAIVACATRTSLLNSTFVANENFERRLAQTLPLSAIQAYCTRERGINDFIQAPVALMSCNRHGTLYNGQVTGFDRIGWAALVIKGEIKGYLVYATRGKHSWFVVETVAPDVPIVYQDLQKVLDK